ncbi:MAG: D-tyrosyl-tRNA(Tyr) deacylase [Proteobacteria bacterium]|nr:D-tyrosyl-tRNA(Tyr) deacylase [Pseudomonadota bacterium]
MRAVVQRVTCAKVEIGGKGVGEIGQGLLVFLGVEQGDSEEDAQYLANKIAHLRIFSDDKALMNHSLTETGGAAMVVSQFTLLADCHKGRRPSFTRAAPPDEAKVLYQFFVSLLRGRGIRVATGEFQEMMEVQLVNDGPVTLILDSKKAF